VPPAPAPSPALAASRGQALEFGQSIDYSRGNDHYFQGVVPNRSQEQTLRFVHITIKLYNRCRKLLGIEDT
jgi:hypothetical protein